MRYAYLVDSILGAVLIASPYVGNFTQNHRALYTNVIVGGLLAIWGIVAYLNVGGAGAPKSLPSHS